MDSNKPSFNFHAPTRLPTRISRAPINEFPPTAAEDDKEMGRDLAKRMRRMSIMDLDGESLDELKNANV